MAIDPTTTTTVKVGQLAAAAYNTTDLIPHEVSGNLKKGNIYDLALFIKEILNLEDAIGFRSVQITDGQTLPTTDKQEFILVGPGTYPNVGGGATITTTESLNALVSNGTFWYIGVEIPVSTLANWGDISGVISDQTDLWNILNLKADLVDGKVPSSQLPSYVDDVVEVNDYASLPSTGETGKIYVTKDTGNIYRWSGSAYIRIADESPVWGIITGTLSDQTDLQNVLDGKFDVPTGDTTQYIAGDGSLITFPIAGQAGTLVRLVLNNSGSTIAKGSVVYINGASGNKPTIAKAIATGDSTSAQTFGLVQADITNNSSGYVVVSGDLIGLNTSGITEGTQLYLSSTTAGEYTTTKQLAPSHLVYVGVVTRSHASLGQIEVKIQNGYELDELHDVAISSKTNKDFLTYESSSDLWKNKSLGTIIGGTSSQFIKGNGSLDSNTYALDSVVVKLTGNQSISGKKSFNLVQTGYNLSLITSDIFSDGTIESNNGMLRLVDNTTSSDLFRLESDGIVFAKAFKKDGGTSSEFLMADGSVTTGGLSGTTNYIPKFTSSSSIGNSLIYDNGTTIGIANGTGSTIGRLFVKGIEAQPNNTITISTPDFVQGDYGSILTIGHNANSGSTPAILRNIINGGSAYGDICFPYGNLGIGTISPSGVLDVRKNQNSTTNFYFQNTDTTNASSRAYINLISGSQSLIFKALHTGGSYIDSSSDLYFQSSNSVKMTMLSGGNVGIGTTNPTRALDVNGTIQSKVASGTAAFVLDSGVDNCQIYFAKNGTLKWANGTNTGAGGANDYAFYTYGASFTSLILYANGNYQFFGSNVSDRRAKEKIEDLDFNATEKIMALQPKSYYMKNDNKKLKYGLIAQDVYEVLPDLVSGDLEAEGFAGLDYNGIIPILVQSIQELKAEIEILKNK